MERRGHLDPAELDALLLGGAQDRGVTVESFHVEGCRTCREALLDLALMAGILRGARLRPTLFAVDDLRLLDDPEPEAAVEDLAFVQEMPRVRFSRKAPCRATPPTTPCRRCWPVRSTNARARPTSWPTLATCRVAISASYACCGCRSALRRRQG
jgi:hypothetical protein